MKARFARLEAYPGQSLRSNPGLNAVAPLGQTGVQPHTLYEHADFS